MAFIKKKLSLTDYRVAMSQNTLAQSAMTEREKMQNQIDSVLEGYMPSGPRSGPALRFVTSSLTVKVPVYHMQGATEREIKCVLTALTLPGLSDDDQAVKWQTFVCTWSCIIFPELVGRMRAELTNNEYVFEPLSQEFINSCVESILCQQSEETAGDKFLTFPAGLPTASAYPMTPELASTVGVESSVAYYAMLVFIMGKSINPDSMVAISTRRPEAIMRKHKTRVMEYILQGDGRIPSSNYSKIQGGWVRSNGPREIIVQHLAVLYSASNRPESLDAIVLNMDMLRNSGQSYFYYIYELLIAHPWCIIEIPALRVTWTHYRRMLGILMSQPDHIRPFFKMMKQDSEKGIRRRDIEPLIGVAIFYAAQTRSSMHQFRITPESQNVIAMFIEKGAEKGITFKEIHNQATVETAAV